MPKASQFRPIIFISHSGRGDIETYPTLKKVEQYLEKRGFDVLLDETRIQGGEPWRNCLHTWMGHCHAAIVFLSPKALASPWVLKETTILSWRQSLSGGKFLLVPVLIGLRASDLAKSEQFNPLALSEIQALKNLTGVTLAKALVKLLAHLRSIGADTPQRIMEDKIANLLGQVNKPSLLARVAGNLGEDLGGWDPKRDLASTAAMLLLQAPLEKLKDGLSPLVGALSEESLRLIVDMLRGSWVNRETASMLTLVAQEPKGKRAAALNATEQEFTATSVVARATGGYPPWSFVRLSSAAGEDWSGSLKAQVRDALEKMTGTKNPAIIAAFIQKKENREPVLIVLPPPETQQELPDDADVEALMNEYPSCTLFLLTGPALPPDDRLAKVRRLSPHLGPNEEIDAYATFRQLELDTRTRK